MKKFVVLAHWDQCPGAQAREMVVVAGSSSGEIEEALKKFWPPDLPRDGYKALGTWAVKAADQHREAIPLGELGACLESQGVVPR